MFKLIMASILEFFEDIIWELSVSAMIIYVYLTLILLTDPFVRKGIDKLKLLTLTELVLVAQIGLVVELDGKVCVGSFGCSWFVIILPLVVLVFAIATLVQDLKKRMAQKWLPTNTLTSAYIGAGGGAQGSDTLNISEYYTDDGEENEKGKGEGGTSAIDQSGSTNAL